MPNAQAGAQFQRSRGLQQQINTLRATSLVRFRQTRSGKFIFLRHFCLIREYAAEQANRGNIDLFTAQPAEKRQPSQQPDDMTTCRIVPALTLMTSQLTVKQRAAAPG